MEQQVMVELQTTIEDNGEKEYNTTKNLGKLFEKNRRTVLMYEESLDDQSLIKTLITIQPDKVTINRSGVVSMNQKFLEKQLTENIYKHPHGNFNMETYTHSIKHEIDRTTKSGRLTIHYTVKLNGQNERKHDLILTYTKEDVQ
ncbi:DUF1934 domain-containing protein [Ornithinibacillus halophilus]|uniref:Uncharacterized beta-barrel protein YwiB, DUF1934 family n=1 Tax=Ornithinibacillus halophilus TaxID=930117 RepID=A0A1M5LSK0_9BACI|nr:DUF1934 domain-containing protein [Ornithinibacillus halophilus]SHG67975.1 Uncharacterized beta-barrel protein YwiB, DUF1934 family [Ornithinibacillus halophilus]